jgi:hypothetical protein
MSVPSTEHSQKAPDGSWAMQRVRKVWPLHETWHPQLPSLPNIQLWVSQGPLVPTLMSALVTWVTALPPIPVWLEPLKLPPAPVSTTTLPPQPAANPKTRATEEVTTSWNVLITTNLVHLPRSS